MIKKLSVALSIALTITISSTTYLDALNADNVDVIDGTTQEISMELNKNVFKRSDNIVLVNEDSIIDSLGATPLAHAKNAPLIAAKKKNLGRVTTNYIKELGVKNATIIGGSGTISKETEESLERMGITVDRVRGKDRYNTSINLARELYKTKGFDKAFVVSSRAGLENPLSIYAYAAQNEYPIIWVSDDNLDDAIDFLKGKDLKEIYGVGDSPEFTSALNEGLDNVNLLGEINKSKSNVGLINEFYNMDEVKKVYTVNIEFGTLSQVNEYISLGAVAGKDKAPILVCNERFTRSQNKFLENNNIEKIIEVGDEVEPYSFAKTIFNKAFISAAILIVLLVMLAYRGIRYEVK